MIVVVAVVVDEACSVVVGYHRKLVEAFDHKHFVEVVVEEIDHKHHLKVVVQEPYCNQGNCYYCYQHLVEVAVDYNLVGIHHHYKVRLIVEVVVVAVVVEELVAEFE